MLMPEPLVPGEPMAALLGSEGRERQSAAGAARGSGARREGASGIEFLRDGERPGGGRGRSGCAEDGGRRVRARSISSWLLTCVLPLPGEAALPEGFRPFGMPTGGIEGGVSERGDGLTPEGRSFAGEAGRPGELFGRGGGAASLASASGGSDENALASSTKSHFGQITSPSATCVPQPGQFRTTPLRKAKPTCGIVSPPPAQVNRAKNVTSGFWWGFGLNGAP